MLVERLEASREAKLQVLEGLLQSPVFGRSDQLRQLLRYLVQEEIEGRGFLITEYAIGVKALGRPVGYSPEIDSTVRTRAHELRRRIDEHYRLHPAESLRLELPKGAYQPRFVRPGPATPEPTEIAEPSPALELQPPRSFRYGFLAGALAASVTALAVWLAFFANLFPAESERALADVWGGMLTPGAKVTVALATPPQLWVRDFGGKPHPVGDPPFLIPVPKDDRLIEWHRRHAIVQGPGDLQLHPNSISPLWGEAAAAFHLAQFLSARGVEVELLGEAALKPAVLKDKNAAVLGRADYSYLAGALQPANAFSIQYVTAKRAYCVVDEKGNPLFSRESGGRVNYGVATFIGVRTLSGVRRTVLASGINSDGAHAALEYATSPANALEIRNALQSRGKDFPRSFQIVVRTRSSDTFTLQAQKVAHRTLE